MKYRNPLIIVLVVALVLVTYNFLITPDNRSFSDRVSDAYHDFQDRTPGQKLGDEVKSAGDKLGDKIKDDTAPKNQ